MLPISNWIGVSIFLRELKPRPVGDSSCLILGKERIDRNFKGGDIFYPSIIGESFRPLRIGIRR